MSLKKTGDIKGNTESLIRNLKTINYPSQTSYKILTSGNPGIYLPIIHYSLFNYSPVVAKFLSDKHYDMFAKNDLDFINTAFHCLITLFNYKPELTTEQFFSNKFAEGKIILCKEIIDLVIQKNNQLNSNNKKKKGINKANQFNKNKNNNNNNNNVSPKFHDLRNNKNNSSNKKVNNSSSNNNSSYFENSNNNNNINNNNDMNINIINNEENINFNNNQNQINNNDEYNNMIINNNNFNASLPMNSIPVPTPKPQYYVSKNINNIQSSVQSFKPKQNINYTENTNQLEVYDSSQEYPLSGQNNSSGNNSNNNSMDFNSVVKIITSLSESVSLMVNKIENFKGNIEDRLNKLEAEIVLIKNKQNYLDSRLNNNSNSNINTNSNNEITNNSNINMNDKNIINEPKLNNYREINKNINAITNNINNILEKGSNTINNNNIYIQDSPNENNTYNKNNPIFTSFDPQIRTNTGLNFDNQNNINNKKYYNTDKRIYNNDTGYNRPYPEEKKVYNVFNYNQENENGFNDINDKNKYSDIDKLIENSEKNFFKTQKLLEDYEKK